MTYYLLSVDATDEQHWQRYNIGLDDKALVDARACIEAEATDQWSFREIHSGPNNPLLFDPVYVFFFREASDIVVLQKFDASRRRLRP